MVDLRGEKPSAAPYIGNPEGFGVLDLQPDGKFQHRYHTYGWTART